MLSQFEGTLKKPLSNKNTNKKGTFKVIMLKPWALDGLEM